MSTARDRVLALLRANKGKWVKSTVICSQQHGGQEGTRRLRELRDEGFKIEHQKRRDGEFEYRLTTEPSNPQLKLF